MTKDQRMWVFYNQEMFVHLNSTNEHAMCNQSIEMSTKLIDGINSPTSPSTIAFTLTSISMDFDPSSHGLVVNSSLSFTSTPTNKRKTKGKYLQRQLESIKHIVSTWEVDSKQSLALL